MHLHFERNANAKCDSTILSLSWMGKVPEEKRLEEGFKLNRNNYYQEGWLASGNMRGVVGVTFTASHARRPHELPLRNNYNLRGHRSEVILVKWNEPYQKLASCDSSGVIFVWIKYEGRWSIELINDRSTPVTHFSWSHDGRMALICYQDGFVLVGSVAGQRYWSSMLSLDARITSGCWTPDDKQVYLGTASAQLVVMDVHGAMVSQIQLVSEGGICTMAWSCEKFKMEECEDQTEPSNGHVLAVALDNGEIVMMRGHDDVSPVWIKTGMRGGTVAMEWANSRELLAVAGTLQEDTNESSETGPFKNVVKFYSDAGILIYTVPIPCTEAKVSALTWGHASRRIFVSCGGVVETARVWRVVAPLQLLARVRAAQSLREPQAASQLPLPPRLQPLVAGLFAHTIRCNVPDSRDLRSFVSRPPRSPGRLHCTMLRHGDDDNGAFTLYLEHLGGLVPLLKGKRTSKIRPEFVIFDPQAEESSITCSIVREGSSSSSSSGGRGSRPADSDDSNSDIDYATDGCSGSPRAARRRRRIPHQREFSYADLLPEDVRLVEVTSNIWGTKFKLHGLAKNVPANLGQVTYKTSLLHLQPRQMTLVITELRDDFPEGPDPTFNPNIFSEDEEEVFNSNTNSPARTNNNVRRKLTLNDRLNSNVNHTDNHASNNNNTASLARAESYEEFPFIDTNETNNVPEPVHNPIRHTSERRCNNTSAVTNRHAISPLRCESSVPTLQSPKNAVAPTDIIFERPSPQTVSCGGRGDFCGGRADYTVRENMPIKSNLDQQSFSLNLSLEPSRHVTIKKVDTHVTDNCLSKLRKNICSRGETARELCEVNTRILKSFCNKNYEHEVHPDAMSRRDTLKGLQKTEELKFIDEETPVETNITNITDKTREMRVQRTTAVVPISPVCANVPLYDTMTRSCSVGYLDLVDPTVLHAQVSITALSEQPRRLVLVDDKKNRRNKKHFKTEKPDKTPSLKKCGKSKSLDSSELLLTDKINRNTRLDLLMPKDVSVNKSVSVSDEPSSAVAGGACKAACEACRADACVCVKPEARDSDSDYSKYYSSLEQLALRLLASRGKRRKAELERESCSAPASPRPARAQPPATPKHRQRHSSSSPIRQLLNSPLLNRRRNKKHSESSDDEAPPDLGGNNYRDLETFQKALLRTKLIRSGYVARVRNKSGAPRMRQFVLHNKAPMWNENSQVYQLDFGGRVTQESAKNFQIEHREKQVMQFGRIDGNAYTLDFQYPFSAIQAFAVALANVTQRLK